MRTRLADPVDQRGHVPALGIEDRKLHKRGLGQSEVDGRRRIEGIGYVLSQSILRSFRTSGCLVDAEFIRLLDLRDRRDRFQLGQGWSESSNVPMQLE
jgi:hypothetical protein